MTRQEKQHEIDTLNKMFSEHSTLYLADASSLTVAEVTEFRRRCFESGIEMKVAKNTLIKKAMEANEKKFEGLFDILKGPTAIMFSEVANTPAKVIKEFRKKHDKPVLKAAYVNSEVFVGDEQVDVLSLLKSKEELIGEVVGLLISPVHNLMSALRSGQNNITGILKTLSGKAISDKSKSENNEKETVSDQAENSATSGSGDGEAEKANAKEAKTAETDKKPEASAEQQNEAKGEGGADKAAN